MRKILLSLALALSGLGTFAVVTVTSTPAAAQTQFTCGGVDRYYPSNFFKYWGLAESSCGQGNTETLGSTCLDVLTGFGWIHDVGYGQTQFGTACDTVSSADADGPDYQAAVGNCYGSGNPNGITEYRTASLVEVGGTWTLETSPNVTPGSLCPYYTP